MKTATSKIKEVVRTKVFTNKFGTTIYHDLLMENGDKIQIGKKTLQKVGWELYYQIEDEGQEYNKAKSIKPEEVAGSAPVSYPSQSSTSTNLNVQNLIVAQSSVASACNYYAKQAMSSKEDVMIFAKEIYEFVISKG